jgi:NAD+ synthase
MSERPSPLWINTQLAGDILRRFLKAEIERAGLQRAVVGLSGGIDSALVCLLAAEALSPKNVLAVCMPYATSAPESLEHAELLIRQSGVNSRTLPITAMVDPLLAGIPADERVRRGNIMARMRMLVLYDQSAEFGALVIGTGNKTEILLGYTTLFGDSACALNPIGDLYKTQVRQLAAAVGVPQVIIDKPPSADLWEGQTDEGELGWTYEKVDRLLYLMVDERYALEDCVEAGFDPLMVKAVAERVRRNQYKRLPPIIAKLSNRTIGYDFLYPRDWGT